MKALTQAVCRWLEGGGGRRLTTYQRQTTEPLMPFVFEETLSLIKVQNRAGQISMPLIPTGVPTSNTGCSIFTEGLFVRLRITSPSLWSLITSNMLDLMVEARSNHHRSGFFKTLSVLGEVFVVSYSKLKPSTVLFTWTRLPFFYLRGCK